METSQLILAMLSAWAILNVIATVRVLMSGFYEPRQKWMQCAVIWLIPFFGAGIALAIAGQPDSTRNRRRGAVSWDLGGTEMFEIISEHHSHAGENHNYSDGHHG